MAITTLDGIIAGMLPSYAFFKGSGTAEAANILHSPAYMAGMPGAAPAPAAGLAGEALTSWAGSPGFPAAVGGKNVYLARLEASSGGGVGGLHLFDRLWQNSGFVVTALTAQTINSVAWPARDANGSVNGVGVNIALEQVTLGGAGTPTFTVTYTNSAGVSGRTGTIGPVPTTLQPGSFYPMALQAGDLGVRSVQSIISSATMTSGSLSFVAYRQIVVMGMADGYGSDRDAVQLGLPLLLANTVPMLCYRVSATGLGNLTGALYFAQG